MLRNSFKNSSRPKAKWLDFLLMYYTGPKLLFGNENCPIQDEHQSGEGGVGMLAYADTHEKCRESK